MLSRRSCPMCQGAPMNWEALQRIDWGTFPDYLSGIGTVGTLAVALWVLTRELDDRRDRDAAQARLVTVDAETASGDVVPVRVTNHSSEPIIGLEVEEVSWVPPHGPDVRWRVPPSIMGARSSASVTPPGESLWVPVEFVNAAGERQGIRVPGAVTVRFSFHDSRGLTWSRVAGEQPLRVINPRGGRRGRMLAAMRRRE